LPRIWLVEVLPDKRVRYRSSAVQGHTLRAAAFPPASADTPSQLPELQRELSNALVQQGLYADEAAAMLDTWRLSYFESEGLRVFFFLPQAWTDARLPLSISTRAQTTRVMLGRIELVTARQRQTLARLESLSLDAYPRLPLYYHDRRVLQASGQSERRLSELYRFAGREVPEPLRLYESLGRFRDALVVHTLNATHDAARRARLERAISAYSACVPEMLPWFSPPPAASAK
ncbi:MAG TPA: hypothetical protein VFP37_01190, partial [Steroidobacteraceae bacterium]|nr:hypothetical protein [Steroidobacteraceae bacterium]